MSRPRQAPENVDSKSASGAVRRAAEPVRVAPVMKVGATVQWYDEGYRYGRLVSIGTRSAIVTYAGKRKHIKLMELTLYVP